MEISRFLQRPETLALRQSFLQNVCALNVKILEGLKKLKENSEADPFAVTARVFLEVHRLKGSGGTYGFNEVSLAYREVLVHIRPPHEEKRTATPSELQNSIHILEAFGRHLPVLTGAFDRVQNAFNGAAPQHLPILGLVNQDRRELINRIEWFFVRQGVSILTMQNQEEALFAFERVRPDLLLLDLHLPGTSGTVFARELLIREGFREMPVYLFSPEWRPEERSAARESGARGLYQDPEFEEETLRSLLGKLGGAAC